MTEQLATEVLVEPEKNIIIREETFENKKMPSVADIIHIVLKEDVDKINKMDNKRAKLENLEYDVKMMGRVTESHIGLDDCLRNLGVNPRKHCNKEDGIEFLNNSFVPTSAYNDPIENKIWFDYVSNKLHIRYKIGEDGFTSVSFGVTHDILKDETRIFFKGFLPNLAAFLSVLPEYFIDRIWSLEIKSYLK